MNWEIDFYDDSVSSDVLSLPPKIQAKMLRLFDLVEEHGPQLGEPHSKPLNDGLFELRVKAQEGIARSIFCYASKGKISILYVFIKKTQKTPKKYLDMAKKRMMEVTK